MVKLGEKGSRERKNGRKKQTMDEISFSIKSSLLSKLLISLLSPKLKLPYFYQFPPSVFFLACPFILPFCLLFLYFGAVESSTHLDRGKYKCDINSHQTGLSVGLTLSIVRVRMTTLPITINIEDPRQALRRLTLRPYINTQIADPHS